MSMKINPTHTLPPLHDLPSALRGEGSIAVELEQGVLILRVSKSVQVRIEALLDKQRTSTLSPAEENELQQYEDVDDYLSLLNRLSRNLVQAQQTQEGVSAS
jgi:hypothetical protein